MRTLLGLIIANSLQLQISHANAPWNIQPSPNENSQFSSIFNQKYAKPGSSKKVNSCAKKSDWSSDYGYLPKIIRNGTYKFLELVPDTNKNFVFSPLSIFSAMGLLVRGTKGVSTSELVRSMSMEREIEFDKNARLRTGGIFKFKRMHSVEKLIKMVSFYGILAIESVVHVILKNQISRYSNTIH